MPGPFPTAKQGDAVREDAKRYGLKPECFSADEPDPNRSYGEAYSDVIAIFTISGDRPDRVVIYKPDGQRIGTRQDQYIVDGYVERGGR